MTPQQVLAGRVAGLLMRTLYSVRYTDMAPFRAIRRDALESLGMAETTFGWTLRQDHLEDDAHRPPKHSWTGLRRHAERGQSQEQSLGEQGIQHGVRRQLKYDERGDDRSSVQRLEDLEEQFAKVTGGHCHVRVFHLSTAPGVRRLTRAKSIICVSGSRTEIDQKVPILGERDNAAVTTSRLRPARPRAQR